MLLAVALHAGFQEGPFFYVAKKGERTNHWIDEAAIDLQLSAELVVALTAWDDEYQSIYDRGYPPDSRFPTPEAERAWIEKGKELAARVKTESPVVSSVDYQANGFYDKGTCVF
ncbi:hypothetical protein [Actinoalloteichus hymeniacidonis]|uniref:Uncharacterized protein n=1 Tax=Actinoalloteichus hymeniacidonis TaxID=340345 RepID=A0AAC9MWG4_9PSEU|nr:hypothetical protein [Actinoalloteichus hymeniacidonis]AOS61036.1 hypothetical protein TL08_00960 [Actinoalloteichus hymeniacidonis]MBB5910964.1 hypothetical protein [Actinoalloteichus hymeniacidonis]